MARSYYGRVSARARDELRKILNRLIVDNNLQVRRTAVTVLAYIENEDDVQSYGSYFTSALEKYAEEEKGGLREKGARLLIDVSSYPQLSEETREAIIPVLQKYSKHSSWEVRHMIANNILKVLKALKVQTFKSRLARVLQNLLADSEPIVRTAADNQVEEYYNYLIETAEEP
ncbi:serine/threonine-protein phosphatase 2A 65 kDa regulatory subunit A alpha isoform-like [Schistocerca serialis cubense]|uniref:serine/threonine-protein phosphatase 2A 65 kDa regulatory subunit A alpha isoform-like n=1 Tax=Schistocerca serialis cubense TaxID=2023355 RepID=UPI00214ECE9B|nr:serine/threonine-protein phosphatase 2A 65 kDa regulatory subunit A alpha isoform-like [Schistocerca serialis cubense]